VKLFYITLGAVAGVLVVRKLTQTAQRFTPAGVQQSMTGSVGNLADAIRGFGAEVRAGMAEREGELRSTLGLDGTHDLVDYDEHPGHTGGLEPEIPEDRLR
jgi:chromosome condensin MukBEF MukE localization factor